MNKIDWRTVIAQIQERHNWPLKTIAHKIGITSDALYRWQRGESEPRYSQGVELLRLAEVMPDGQP